MIRKMQDWATAAATALAAGLACGVCLAAGVTSRPTDVTVGSGVRQTATQMSPEETAKIKARVAELVRQLSHDEWSQREAASEELRKIGVLALDALTEAAAGSKDPEVVSRAKTLLRRIRASMPQKVDPAGTNGLQLVYRGVEQLQTFLAPANKIETVRVRLARTTNVPTDSLRIDLRTPERDGGKVLGTAIVRPNWTDDKGVQRSVTGFFSWIAVDLKAEQVKKGGTYELIFSSATSKDAPWFVNCFYRDTYAGGEHRQRADGKTAALGKFDLVFEAIAGEAIVTSVPAGVTLPYDEAYGPAHDGTVIGEPPDAAPAAAPGFGVRLDL